MKQRSCDRVLSSLLYIFYRTNAAAISAAVCLCVLLLMSSMFNPPTLRSPRHVAHRAPAALGEPHIAAAISHRGRRKAVDGDAPVPNGRPRMEVNGI